MRSSSEAVAQINGAPARKNFEPDLGVYGSFATDRKTILILAPIRELHFLQLQ